MGMMWGLLRSPTLGILFLLGLLFASPLLYDTLTRP
jgi:hypothetical protein